MRTQPVRGSRNAKPTRVALRRDEAARRAEQRRRTRLGLCWNCGAECIDAIDAEGQPYRGCSQCVIVLPEALRKAGAR